MQLKIQKTIEMDIIKGKRTRMLNFLLFINKSFRLTAPFVLFLESMPGNYFMQRQMRVTICARVQMPSGSKVTALVPLVTPALTAHSTAVS